MPDYIRNRHTSEETDSFFCRFTFGQFFALLVLEVFTLFFVFYLGARYGREFLGLDKVQVAEANKESANAASEQSPEQQVISTTDPEAQKLAKDLIAKAETLELKDRITKMFEAASQGNDTKAVSEDKTLEVVTVNHADETQKDEQSTIHLKAPVDEKEVKANAEIPEEISKRMDNQNKIDPSEKSNSTDSSVVRVKSVENGRYSIQVGSYPQMGEATHIVDKWKGKGYPAYVMIADIPDRGRWYRVRIGGFGSREEASKYLKDFQSKEDAEALIVMNEQ